MTILFTPFATTQLDAAALDRIADEMAATPALCAPRPAVGQFLAGFLRRFHSSGLDCALVARGKHYCCLICAVVEANTNVSG